MEKGLHNNPSINDDRPRDDNSSSKKDAEQGEILSDVVDLLSVGAYLPDDPPGPECFDMACVASTHVGDFLHIFMSMLECLG